MRRNFLRAAACVALGGMSATHAAQTIAPRKLATNVVQMKGGVLVNRQRLTTWQWLQTGDEIITGPHATLTFFFSDSAFHIRQNSRVVLGRGASINQVGSLQVSRGAVASVWGRDSSGQIITPHVTANIWQEKSRAGCGVYTEIMPNSSGSTQTYLCNCYGGLELVAGERREMLHADHHSAIWADPVIGRYGNIASADTLNHADRELEYLARLVGQRTPWQTLGKKIG